MVLAHTRLPKVDPLLPLPDNILHLARADPSRTLGFIIDDVLPNTEPALTRVTWRHALRDFRQRAKELVAATEHPAREPGEDKFVVGLLLRTGYSYFVTLTATIMLRWTPLVLSPRNSASGTIHLMKSAQSTYLIVDSDLLSFAENLNESSFRIVKTADDILAHVEIGEATDVWPDYPVAEPEKLLVEARTGIYAYLHTSGSTGHPKIIPNTHHYIVTNCAAMRRQRPESIGGTFYTMMPLFHSIGVFLTYALSLGLGVHIHFLNLRQPPTPEVVLRHLALHTEVERGLEILLPPSIIENIVDGELRERGLNLLKRTAIVFTAGARLRKDVGDFLRHSGVPIQQLVGMTETGPLSMLALSKESDGWEYMVLNDQYKYYFKAMGGDEESREMIVLPSENTPCVINHWNPDGLATSDLWEPHPDPEKSHLWRILGRADDITVLSNGEKTNNKQLESLLSTSPLIDSAAIFGAGRFLNGAIISPATQLASYDPEAVSAYLDTIWPHVEHVNGITPQHSQLIRPLVLVAIPSKPFMLTDKQSLARKRTVSQYDDEIAAAYTRVEEGEYEEVALPEGGFMSGDAEGIAAYVQAVVDKVLRPPAPLAQDADLFDAGLESLLAMRVRSALMAALKKSGKSVVVPRNIVYSAPTQRGLAKYLENALAIGGVTDSEGVVPDTEIESSIAEMVDGCTVGFPLHRPADVYAVTGTTGSLGSFFTMLLLGKPEVRKIYLLNRSASTGSIEERHQTVFRDRGLDYDLLAHAVNEGRAVYLEVALGEENLGLDQKVYDAVRAELTHIVHCAWLVNFNLILASFKTQVQGVRNLIDLALSSPLPAPAHLIFLSSISVVGRSANTDEVALTSPASCLPQGYAHAKYAAEKVIEQAVAQRPGFRATIIRSGQIAGAERTGAWSRTEHIPILLKSCVDFGLVPEGLPTVRWLPVNVAAEVVYKEIQAAETVSRRTEPAFYNLENALATPWELVAGTMAKAYALPIVPAAQWLEQVRKRTDHPANRLLAFFEDYMHGVGLPALQLQRAREAAGDLVDYVVDQELIRVYASYACRESLNRDKLVRGR
ncbi:acetyl-CoA synthetase-like protein [Mycena metata]|uniref:Acetyl-CoA synthetase-like protein n=1 Tax=Mycena metata TaxID=1033252 RepID=A0AAD7NEE7_9AGAR|nr:acetyl-CoA synthetase-like protein [Mycena metata]